LHVPWQNVAWAAGQGARIEDRDARGHRITLVQADPDQLFQAWIVLLIPTRHQDHRIPNASRSARHSGLNLAALRRVLSRKVPSRTVDL